MKIVCDNCSTKYSIADEKVRGKVFKIKCKKCSHIIVVKGQEATGEGQPAGFDQKETRVFDYSGFEGQKDGGGGGGAEPIWHLVIDREQVGPLTVAEVQQKWATGEADRDTYAWREGFGDWQRLGAIEELADVLHAAGGEATTSGDEAHVSASAESGGAGLFGDGTGTPAQGTPTIGRADPTDLFAGAGTSTEDEVPADLFGGARSSQPSVFSSTAAPAAAAGARGGRQPKEDLFGSGNGSEMGMAGEATSKSDSRPMTAQRNENSVLFSLNNLSALASSEPTAAPTPSQGSPSSSGAARQPSAFGSGSAEGSGLIDIRAMAAMTLGATKKEDDSDRPRSRRVSEDDLPVFSASSFSAPAAGVLLPSVQPQSNRMFYIAIAAVGVLALTAIILVAVILLGKPAPTAATVTPTTPLRADPVTPPVVPPEATAPTTPPSTPPNVTPPKPNTPAVTPPVATPERPSKPPPTTPKPPRPEPTKPPEVARPTDTPKPPPETPKPPADQVKPAKCDEVACIVSPDLPCCPKRAGTPKPAATGDSSLAERLDQSDIIAGMKAVNGRVMACNDRFRVPGAFKVKVTVAADGSVTAASATPPVAGSAAAGCVEGAVKSARFKKTKNSITFNYPYTFH